MNDEELVAVAAKLKEFGNLKFKASDLQNAKGLYLDAISHLETCKK